MSIKKPIHNTVLELDIRGIADDFAAEMLGFGGLDDMAVLIDGVVVHDGKIARRFCHGEISTEDKTCGYINYLLDALIFLYDNDKLVMKHLCLDGSYVVSGDVTVEDYRDYIDKFYGNNYSSDAEQIGMAICQSTDFLMTAWKLIESNEEVEKLFSKYIKSIY